MTKLEWCRENAPEALKNVSDDELLSIMSSAYELMCKESLADSSVDDSDSDLSTQVGRLDYVFTELAKAFGDKLAFKGGYMLMKLITNDARLSEDIDFSILTSDIYEEIKFRLVKIAEHLINKGIIVRYDLKEEIAPTMSGGIKMYDSTGQMLVGVDVGWHNTGYGTSHYRINDYTVVGFEIERMLSDKLTAILSRRRFRRPKDIYDVYIIASTFDFDACKILQYMAESGREIEWDHWPFSETVNRELAKAYDKLVIKSVLTETIRPNKPDYAEVIALVNKVFEGVTLARIGGFTHWKAEYTCFRKE